MASNEGSQTPKLQPPEGMIYPPPDIRSIVDKTAGFVAGSQHGSSLEEKIKAKERSNAKFAFLNSADAYHGYYKWKIEKIKLGENDDPNDMIERSQSNNLESIAINNNKPIPKEPLPFEFIAEIPENLIAVDLDIIRLTALFTARRGKAFISMLGGRENRNPQFDFLRPNHSSFGLFNNYVEQYLKVIKGTSKPLDEEFDKLSLTNKKKSLIDSAKSRSEWESYKREGAKKDEEESEKERIAFQSIDWQDFVVVETIELSAADKELELPSPLSIREVRNLSIAQKKMATLLDEEEVEEDQQLHENEVDQQSKEDEVENELRGKEIKQSIMSAPEGMKIKANYVPKSQKQSAIPQGYSRSPISGALVPNEEFANHLRIELLDPKWQEKKEYAESRRQAAQLLQQGADVAGSLKNLAQGRTDIFGQDSEKAERKRREAEILAREAQKKREVGVWDGHTASAQSIAEKYQVQANLENQVESMHKRLGLGGSQQQQQEKPMVGPHINSFEAVYDPTGATISAAPAPASLPSQPMPVPTNININNNIRTAEQAGFNDHEKNNKKQKVVKLPEGQFYSEEEWLSYHPENQINLIIQLPIDNSNPEWGLDGSTLELGSLPLTLLSGTLRDHIGNALEVKNGLGKRGPPIGRMKLDHGPQSLSNSKSLASYNLEDGDQINLSVRPTKK